MVDALRDLPTLLCSRQMSVPTGPRKIRPTALEIPEDQLEEQEATLCVNNTFIHFGSALVSPSLRERAVRTCPSRRIGCLAGTRLGDVSLGRDEAEPPSPAGLHTPCEIQTPCGMQTPCLIQTPLAEEFAAPLSWGGEPAAVVGRGDVFFHDPGMAYRGLASLPQHIAPVATAAQFAVTDLRLADLLEVDRFARPEASVLAVQPALVRQEAASSREVFQPSALFGQAPPLESPPWFAAAQPVWSSAPVVPPSPSLPPPPPGPALGSSELPSIGSATHSKGSCRPCAFLHTKGCENGLACTFCHLCEPGERKRRQKEKLQQRRAAQQARQNAKAERQPAP